jgi:Uma2 family endonuclease
MTTAPKQDPSRPGPTESNGAHVPPLRNGDHLDRAEFERRYDAMADVKKAELIEGVVFMPSSPVSFDNHGRQHSRLMLWLGTYLAHTPGVDVGDNATVRLDDSNEPQPDAFLLIQPERGGRTTRTGGYVTGGPELAAEVAASSVSIDRNSKLTAYRRNGVQEYVIWRTEDGAIDWFRLRAGQYEPLQAGPDGIVRSEVFAGLWLDVQALLADDLLRVLSVLQQGIASPEHAAFVAGLPAPPTA